MAPPRRIVRRTTRAVAAAALLYAGPIATASAHVEASSGDAVCGATALVSFQVPNESTTGAPTTALTVQVSAVSGVRAEAKPGWSTTLVRDGGLGPVRSVTWTSATGAGIAADEFGVFTMSAKLPDADTVSFPATQTYADGMVVKWDQPSTPGQAEPEHPAPALTLGHAAPATAASTPAGRRAADNTARLLAGAALLLGAASLGIAVMARRT